MTVKDILKDADFEEVAEVKVDSKNRVTLSRKNSKGATRYRIYRNSIGQIILDPQVTVPAYEAWLFRNEEAKTLVRKGIQDAKNKRLLKAAEDYSKYPEDSE